MTDACNPKNFKEYSQNQIQRELQQCIDLLKEASNFIGSYDPSVCGTGEYKAIVRSVSTQLLATLPYAEQLERSV